MKKLKICTIGFVICIGFSSCGNSRTPKIIEEDSTEDTVMTKSIETSSSNSDESYSVSSGYSTDPNYRPTVSDDGDYHTIDGKRRQIQYQGSQEQRRDLDMIDEYMRNNPEY